MEGERSGEREGGRERSEIHNTGVASRKELG